MNETREASEIDKGDKRNRWSANGRVVLLTPVTQSSIFHASIFGCNSFFGIQLGTRGPRLLLSVARGTRLEFPSVVIWFVGVFDEMGAKTAEPALRHPSFTDFGNLLSKRH